MKEILAITRKVHNLAVRLHVFALRARVRSVRSRAKADRRAAKAAWAAVNKAYTIAEDMSLAAMSAEKHANSVTEAAALEAKSIGGEV